MKKLIVPICILFLSTAAFSQTRSRTTSKRGTQSSKTQQASSQASAEAKTAGATKVADQIKNLTRFVYLLGGVAKNLGHGTNPQEPGGRLQDRAKKAHSKSF